MNINHISVHLQEQRKPLPLSVISLPLPAHVKQSHRMEPLCALSAIMGKDVQTRYFDTKTISANQQASQDFHKMCSRSAAAIFFVAAVNSLGLPDLALVKAIHRQWKWKKFTKRNQTSGNPRSTSVSNDLA